MAKRPNPTSATPEVIKIEADQFHRVAMERKKDLKMEMEMLARERDLLKKEVGLTEKMQKYLELQKCSVEEKLERSNKRCEELEESVGGSERKCEELEAKVNKLRQKLSRSRRKCKELRRKEIEAETRNEETNWDVDGGDGGIFLEKEPRNGETKIDQVLNVDHASDKSVADAEEDKETLNVLEMDENGKRKANAALSMEAAEEDKETLDVPELDENGKHEANVGDGDAFSPEVYGNSDKSGGSRGIGLPMEVTSDFHDPMKKHLCTEGDRELFHGGTREDGTEADFTRPVSKPSFISDIAESQGSMQDNDDKRPEAEVRGSSTVDVGTEEAKNSVFAQTKQFNQVPNLEAGGQSKKDNQGETPQEVKEGGQHKPDNQGKNFHEVEEGGSNLRGVARHCNLGRIDKIKLNLEKANLKLFEQSCFGHLLKIGNNQLKFHGQLFLQLLVHLDVEASKKERQLVFNLNSSRIRFRAQDFALITGLRLGTSGEAAAAAATKPSSIHKKVFNNRPRITLKEVEEAFLRVSRDHEGRGELTLNLALLYFLFGVLLPRASQAAKVKAEYLPLVEDLEKFNAFPWGRVSYEFLVPYVLSARLRMDSHEFAANMTARLDIQGFVFALQIWAYEVMPSLGEYCAQKVKNCVARPRILRWTTPKKIISFECLKKFFTPRDEEDLVMVHEIKEEVEEFLSPQPKRAKVVSNKDQKCSTSGAKKDVIIFSSDHDDSDDDDIDSDDDVDSDDGYYCSTTAMDRNYLLRSKSKTD